MKSVIILFVMIIPFPAISQDNVIARLNIDSLTSLAVDRAGDFYAVTKRSVIKIDSGGKQVATYQASSDLTSFDPGNGVRQLAYLRKEREAIILSPTLDEKTTIDIDQSLAIEPWLMCTSGDYDVIIFDAADGTVKKMDTRTKEVLSDFELSDSDEMDTYGVLQMSFYQGYIFLLHKEGRIVMYNRFGKAFRTFETSATSFHFLGQEIYYLENSTLVFIDLFSDERRARTVSNQATMALVTDTRQVLGDNHGLITLRNSLPK